MRNILVFVGFVILATTIINCSIVMPDIDLDSNLQVVHQEDLIADKVKGTASKKNVTKTGTSKGVPKSTMIREAMEDCMERKCGDDCNVRGVKDIGRCNKNMRCDTSPRSRNFEKKLKCGNPKNNKPHPKVKCYCDCERNQHKRTNCNKTCKGTLNRCKTSCKKSIPEGAIAKDNCIKKCKDYTLRMCDANNGNSMVTNNATKPDATPPSTDTKPVKKCTDATQNKKCVCPGIRGRAGNMVGKGSIGKCAGEECGSCPMPGRPFAIDGKYRTSTSLVDNIDTFNAGSTWKVDQVPQTLANNSINQAIALEFSIQGEGEHASVASFARHTLQLMTMGAPPELLIGSQKASMDEIRHAKMCYGIAGTFLQANILPSSLDIDGSVKALSSEEIIQSVIGEGCIGETISAVRAQLGSHYAKQPMVKETLERIASDETNHAQLAWNTVQWAIERFPQLQGIAEETFRAQLDRPINAINSLPTDYCYDCERDSALHDHGLLLEDDNHNTENLGIREVIKPAVQQNFQNVEMISDKILNMDFSKYY